MREEEARRSGEASHPPSGTRGTDADLLGVRSGSIAASDFQQFCVDRAINGDSKT